MGAQIVPSAGRGAYCFRIHGQIYHRTSRLHPAEAGDEVLVGCVADVFGAGSESVRVSIGWLMYTMAAFPDVQKKIQKEILEIIGPGRNPDYQDQKSMPFTQAVILEIFRWITIVPLNIFR
ncbi:hypothetical protein AVEN_250223-1 [Araneus ventricosus]|uniref:Uncharacterized protein n=1 Tax=Araneus ventricosus TaxID=182803 RepID=A0A4Y2FET3_ARAVE|nr:hypothetical protein AVEN_250223-1 [Araneus ventricosus]